MMRTFVRSVITCVVGGYLLATAGQAQENDDGTTETQEVVAEVVAVRGDVRVTAPQGRKRSLDMKSELYVGETLSTGKRGRVQLSFTDRSVVSLGRNTTMIIDAYSFNPDQSEGEMQLNVRDGIFRVMGGAIQEISPEQFKTRTPTASIGIRGSMFVGQLTAGKLTVVFLGGRGITVGNRQGQVEISRPGHGTVVESADDAPEDPRAFSAGQIGVMSSEVGGDMPEDGEEEEAEEPGAGVDRDGEEDAEEGEQDAGGEEDQEGGDEAGDRTLPVEDGEADADTPPRTDDGAGQQDVGVGDINTEGQQEQLSNQVDQDVGATIGSATDIPDSPSVPPAPASEWNGYAIAAVIPEADGTVPGSALSVIVGNTNASQFSMNMPDSSATQPGEVNGDMTLTPFGDGSGGSGNEIPSGGFVIQGDRVSGDDGDELDLTVTAAENGDFAGNSGTMNSESAAIGGDAPTDSLLSWGYWRLPPDGGGYTTDLSTSTAYDDLDSPTAYWIAGERTPCEYIENLMAQPDMVGRYTGGARCAELEGGVFQAEHIGESDLTVDFSRGDISGDFSFPESQLEMSTHGRLEPDGSGFAGDITSVRRNAVEKNINSNSMQGDFYGSQAEAVGGSFSADTDQKRYLGVFGAEQ